MALLEAKRRENAQTRRRRGRWLNMMAYFLGESGGGRTLDEGPRGIRVRSDPSECKIGAELPREGEIRPGTGWGP